MEGRVPRSPERSLQGCSESGKKNKRKKKAEFVGNE
jgi:hypothetical protein